MQDIIITHNEAETKELGFKIAQSAKAGNIYALIGDLGCGKTVFTKGFASGLGITDYVDSPTFTIVKEYDEGRLPLYHFDVYRVLDVEEMDDIGYDEYFFSDGVCLIEWANQVAELLPPETIYIHISKRLDIDADAREIKIEDPSI